MKQYEHIVKSADYIDSLISEYQWLNMLKGKDKPYESLLDYLMKLGEFESLDEDNYSRTKRQITHIANELNCKNTHITKWLPKIYDDIFTLNNEAPELFYKENALKYVFSFNSDCGYSYGLQLWMPIILNKYDTFIFNFIKAKVNQSHFWVKNVSVIHEYGKLYYQIDLKGGYLNSYRELLLEKVKFINAISWHDLIESSDYDLDDKLREYERSGYIRESEESLQKRRKRFR